MTAKRGHTWVSYGSTYLDFDVCCDLCGCSPTALAATKPCPKADQRPGEVGIECGKCGGGVYMHTCDTMFGTGHEWALIGECQRCGERNSFAAGCPQCAPRGRGPGQ